MSPLTYTLVVGTPPAIISTAFGLMLLARVASATRLRLARIRDDYTPSRNRPR